MASGRDPNLWLRDLRKAQADAEAGLRPKITIMNIADLSENADPFQRLEPSSPRSVEAFLRLGIDPEELRKVPLEDFVRRERATDLANLLYTAAEKLRQERLNALLEQRQRLIESSVAKATSSTAHAHGEDGKGSEMLEMEAARLDMLRRRQERELQQLEKHELARKAIQDKADLKVRQMEAKAEEQRKAKAANDAAWRKAQRDRDMQRVQDDLALEKETKALDLERQETEREMNRKAAEAEKLRLREKFLREQERLEKGELARKETERILSEQQAAVDARKAQMVKKEVEKEKKKAEQAAERAAVKEEARVRAEERVSQALQSNREILIKKREEYDKKQEENELRRSQKEEARRAEDAAAVEADGVAAKQRQEAYAAACRIEEERIQNLTLRGEVKKEKLEALQDRRSHENRRRALLRELELRDKKNKVDGKARVDAWERSELLEKIKADTERTRDLKEQRTHIQLQRRQANMDASFERQKLVASYQRGAQKAAV